MRNKEKTVKMCGGIKPIELLPPNNLTELVFILDRSGSMCGLESDTIGGFNSMIEKQKKTEGEAFVSTVLFSDDSQVLHDRVDISKIKPMTADDYTVDIDIEKKLFKEEAFVTVSYEGCSCSFMVFKE